MGLLMELNDVLSDIKYLVDGILKAYNELCNLLSKPLPPDIVRRALREVLHVAVHELAHEAMRTSYPDFEHMVSEWGILGECVDEVGARVLELIISNRLGIPAHTIEEQIYELRLYANLAKMKVSSKDLEELYTRVAKLIEEKHVNEFLNLIVGACRKWLRS